MNKIRERINNTAVILDIDQAMDQVREIRQHGIAPGLSTGWINFDQFYKIPPIGQLNVITGFPGVGKSELVESLAANMVNLYDWRIFEYSPENTPAHFHLRKWCEKLTGKPFFGNYIGYENVTYDDIEACREKLRNNWAFVDCHVNNATIDQLLNSIFDECLDRKINMAIIDPWNKVEYIKPSGMSETKFIGRALTRISMFAKQKNIQFWIVAHPAKPAKLKDGSWARCTLYDISDSAHWYNMVDNGFVLQRSWSSKAGDDNLAELTIAKIKEKDYGKCGDCLFEFDRACGKYKGVYHQERELPNGQSW